MSQVKVVKTGCLFCPPGCGLDVHVKDNKPVKVEGMLESVVGPICIKGEMIPEFHETELKNRLLHPLKRDGIGWKEISWDEALDTIVQKLKETKEKYGPQAALFYDGGQTYFRDCGYYARRFLFAYGTPNYYLPNVCYYSKVGAGKVTYGDYSPPTFIGTKLIVVWAANPTGSVPFAADTILMAKSKGAKVVVIDPRRTLLAKAADLWLQIRPGTDVALALSALNVIISERLYDEEFVGKYTIGFDKLREHIKQYTPEWAEGITWVPAERIREFARMYATAKPATIFQGNCMDNVDNGFQACRAINCMIAISGNLDIRGGSTLMPVLYFNTMPFYELPKEKRPTVKAIGQDEYPLYFEISGSGVGMEDAILTEKPYPIKVVIMTGHNAIVTDANTNKMKKALEKLDFFVVMDPFMTETAALADMVLPSTYFLEQQSLYSYVGRPLIILFNKAIEPPEDCWPEWKFWFELAKRMGYEKELPWKDIDEAQNEILSKDPFYTDLDTLRKNPGGYYFSKRRWKKYETEGLKTPSGKVELYSETLEKIGQPPLPTYVEPAESPISKPDIAKRYPLILITGLRSLYYDHSMHRSTPSLRAKDPQPMAEINTDTARKLGINSGDMVIIESPRGAIQMKAAVTSDIHSQVVSVPHGWGGLANQNILTDDIHDPVIGSSTMRALLCRVRKGELTQAPKVVLG